MVMCFYDSNVTSHNCWGSQRATNSVVEIAIRRNRRYLSGTLNGFRTGRGKKSSLKVIDMFPDQLVIVRLPTGPEGTF